MKIVQLLVFAILISFTASAQIAKLDTLKTQEFSEENDTILKDPILLEEVVIHKYKLDPESKKQFLILQNRVYKVYPYAKIAAERLTGLNRNMAALNSNKEKIGDAGYDECSTDYYSENVERNYVKQFTEILIDEFFEFGKYFLNKNIFLHLAVFQLF